MVFTPQGAGVIFSVIAASVPVLITLMVSVPITSREGSSKSEKVDFTTYLVREAVGHTLGNVTSNLSPTLTVSPNAIKFPFISCNSTFLYAEGPPLGVKRQASFITGPPHKGLVDAALPGGITPLSLSKFCIPIIALPWFHPVQISLPKT